GSANAAGSLATGGSRSTGPSCTSQSSALVVAIGLVSEARSKIVSRVIGIRSGRTTASPRTERCSITSPSRRVRASTTAPGISACSISLASALSTLACLRRIRLHCMHSPRQTSSPARHPRFEHLERARVAVDRSADTDRPRAVVAAVAERQAGDERDPVRARRLLHHLFGGGLGVVLV